MKSEEGRSSYERVGKRDRERANDGVRFAFWFYTHRFGNALRHCAAYIASMVQRYDLYDV